jgi:hypothetical protein
MLLAHATLLPVDPASRITSATWMATAGPEPDLTSARRVIPAGLEILVNLAMPKKPTTMDPAAFTSTDGALIR